MNTTTDLAIGPEEFARGTEFASPVLELSAVTKVYPGQPPMTALAGVSLTICQGELAAIIGPSGSGKSTLLHVMGILDRPTSGIVRVTGLDIAQCTDSELAALRATRIGFVFQQFFLAEHATVLENVADGLLYTGTRASARRKTALAALGRVGLAHRARARPTQLSATAIGVIAGLLPALRAARMSPTEALRTV